MSDTVAVRALCQFSAKVGDLDRHFTPGPSAQEGMAGHAAVAARRGTDYQTEVTLSEQHGGWLVRGRADGYDSKSERLDECKTHRGDISRVPANHRALHWAQLKMYGAMLCARDALPGLHLALVYFDIDSQQETVLSEYEDSASLREFFEEHCGRYGAWMSAQREHIVRRNARLQLLTFPFSMHDAQRQLARAAYRAASSGQCLLAQAPTGVGKTLGTLFPCLKAMAAGRFDKVFYLVPKSTGRVQALQALRQLQSGGQMRAIRILDLTAREKACLSPQSECNGQSCAYARGFYDRLPAARDRALSAPCMDATTLRQIALETGVCPYYLGQELVRWSDVIVADYNQYFDHNALLHGLASENEWRIALLVDEAHNLVERARQMYSGALTAEELAAAIALAPPPLRRSLQQIQQQWRDLADAADLCYRVYEQPNIALREALQHFIAAYTQYSAGVSDPLPPALQSFAFAAMRFERLAQTFAEHSLADGEFNADAQCLTIRNIVPAAFVGARLKSAHSAVLFSATLPAPDFYRDVLGVPATAVWLDVESPFSHDQLIVRLHRQISTRLPDRRASLRPLCQLIADQYARVPGNYLVFASSFDYSQALAETFRREHAEIDCWQQLRGMSDAERAQFLERFAPSGRGVGFAVLGGAFAEGVDLPGTRLVGAFIATLGLPQVNAINEQVMRRLEHVFGQGYDYTYLFPGVQKVIQAAGRVIRSTSDRGTVVLIDHRLGQTKIRRLLPKWWRVVV